MTRVPAAFVLAVGLAASSTRGAPPPGRKTPPMADPSPLRAAERALAGGLPSVAVARLRPFLAADPPPAERRAAGLLLARARLETGDGQGALDALPAGDDAPDAAVLRAAANAMLGRWEPALADYERAGDGPPARFGRAECLRALGRGAEAETLLAGLARDPTLGIAVATRRAELALDGNRPAGAEAALRESPAALGTAVGRYLLGRAQLAAGQAAEAEATFNALAGAGPEGFTETLATRVQIALARARVAGGETAGAIAGLERFADRSPRQPQLGEIFDTLEELRRRNAVAAAVVPTGDAALVRWQRDTAEPWRGGFAALVLARARRAAGQTEDAGTILAEFPTRYPEHPWRARAGIERAALLLAGGRPSEARAVLAAVRALPGGDAEILRVNLDGLEARVDLALGDYPAAATLLEALSEAPGLLPARAESALVGSALARLRAQDEEGFQAGSEALERRFPNGRWRRSFHLEEGLIRAAGGNDQGATTVLRAFLAGPPTPEPRRTAAARLALGEIAFGEGDVDTARAELRFVADTDLPGDTGARVEMLALLAADAPGPNRDEDGVIARARTFLARRPTSPLAAEVRLKLGEIYYRREDYPDAETELELVPATAPGPVYEAARYLAGLAALGSQSPAGANRAVELFENVAKLNGPLKPAARLRQAETLRDRLGKPVDALVLYDAILAGTNPVPDPETRCAALIGKAEGILRVASSDRDRALEAARMLAAAAAVPDAPLPWRRQALGRRGAALERAGDPEEAVAAYTDVLEIGGGEDAGGDDLTWFYRAGFAAARLLRANNQWTQAIAVYDRLARADGPLRAEAESQARALRLEHFVWGPVVPE